MSRIRLCGLVWLALFSAAVPARDRETQPPVFFRVTEIGKESIGLKGPGTATHVCPIKDLESRDASGKKLSADDLRTRLKVGSVVVVASDENEIDPACLEALKEGTVVLRGVTVLLARADNPGRGWANDLEKMKASGEAVTGRVMGAEFKPDKIALVSTGLSLRSGKDTMHLFLGLKAGQGIEGKTFEFSADDEKGVPALHYHIHSVKPLRVGSYTKGYTMRLEFGKEKDGSVPGKLYLCLPDRKKSWIAGSFALEIK